MTNLGAPSKLPSIPVVQTGKMVRPMPEIPDHTVYRQIGSGAYGEVWLAKSHTGAWRAVKVIRREDFEDERTFNREFEGILNYEPIARNHPGLVHILHVGRHDGENPFYYYVMELGDDAQAGVHINPAEYIPRTLQTDKKLAGNKPLPLEYCLEVGSQLSHALIYLHSKELTHRDIKPANVVFVNGRPKLADIGLVALQDQRSFVGTEGFIPPEGPGTKRADVYALAKVLYEISTGKDRMDFPELPDQFPDDTLRKKRIAFNQLICKAAEPRLDKCVVCTAEELAEEIDALRGYNVHPKSKFKFKRNSIRFFPNAKIFFSGFLGAILAMGGAWLVFNWDEMQLDNKIEVEETNHTASSTSNTPSTKDQGVLIITSVPTGASVYAQDGTYLDETPYGPVELNANETYQFIIKKNGFADKFEEISIKNGKTNSITSTLKEYNPPKNGEDWKDALGTIYKWDTINHKSSIPVLQSQFELFLKSLKKNTSIVYQYKAIPDEAQAKAVITNQEGISAYLNWLNNISRENGLLGEDFSITAQIAPEVQSENNELYGYKLTASRVYQVPITVVTNPPGASIFYNGKIIGRSPLEHQYVNQEPFNIDVKLPGYATMHRRGIDPQDLYLSLDLQQDKSIIFGQKWNNSLGMEFIPINGNTMASSHETRHQDYQSYLKNHPNKKYKAPNFSFEGNHPVTNVTKKDAEEFAQWLTVIEREAGLIENTDTYRLPTDEEWSTWVQINDETGTTPYEKSMSSIDTQDSFLWGKTWPPLRSTGNFADKSALVDLPSSRIIVGYEDSYPYTSPVKSFESNTLGMYDLDGNVMEWVQDSYGGEATSELKDFDVARGGSYLSFRPKQLATKTRTPLPPNTQEQFIGFRLVLERKAKQNLQLDQ